MLQYNRFPLHIRVLIPLFWVWDGAEPRYPHLDYYVLGSAVVVYTCSTILHLIICALQDFEPSALSVKRTTSTSF